MKDQNLIKKYNIPVPRYTSYPTVPYWNDQVPLERAWKNRVKIAFSENREISLYIHLPYCENLCTYCGCNKRITKNHKVEEPYIKSVLQEWQLYLNEFPGIPLIKEIHLGGGTPTFFQPENLKELLLGISSKAQLTPDATFSFEAHPNSTSKEHLLTLYAMGFRRISIGVQDFDEDILKVINRKQSVESVERVTRKAREIGYTSINYDLIYGLPFQTPAHIQRNLALVKKFRPDRIAFYSYAHVPWNSPSQRAYSEEDLPQGKAKRELYELGLDLLGIIGYYEIGMDHFALPTDELFRAQKAKRLHRNFMGYTPNHTRLSIGLGVSAISDSWHAYIQNVKKVEEYQRIVASGKIPFFRGHLLSDEDQIVRQHILNLMCHYTTDWLKPELQHPAIFAALSRLEEMEQDGLIDIKNDRLKVMEKGKPFIRNICMAFDTRYWARQPKAKVFSQSV